jgi:hypothetical protein
MKERGAFITLLEEIAFELLSKEHSLSRFESEQITQLSIQSLMMKVIHVKF